MARNVIKEASHRNKWNQHSDLADELELSSGYIKHTKGERNMFYQGWESQEKLQRWCNILKGGEYLPG